MTGVLALQGDFSKHLEVLERLGEPSVEVRSTAELDVAERLIIPGGESTTVGLLLHRHGLGDEIRRRAEEGMPIWGTCMGMIMMARSVEGRPQQFSLDLFDIEVRRNAFGAQIHSFETELDFEPLDQPVVAVFIRAPIVTQLGERVQHLASVGADIVAVREGNLLGTSFHPELTGDDRIHEWFLSIK